MSRPVRLRAPRKQGAVVAEPPLDTVGELLDVNRRRLRQPAAPLLGRPFHELQRAARQAVLTAALDYLRQACEPIPSCPSASILMAGHQPELFHPGVWIKNFALHRLARQSGSTPINLIVDNDTVKTTAMRLPVVTRGHAGLHAHLTTVPFDHWTPDVAYEERAVKDEELFASFAERARQDWDFVPLLASFWPEVTRQRQRTSLLGERFAAARRTFERRWGCHNLEVPVSRVCQTEPFAWFACHLLHELPRFHAIYNECVRTYRRQYGIRNRYHPVPELAAEGEWLEVPFWAWRAGPSRRQRLFACLREGQCISLRAGEEAWPELPWDGAQGVSAWQELERRGFKVRSRALTNTLYARLFLAELFIHGIGGGKYDELTDAIAQRFYGVEPPRYLVLSGTLLLPFDGYAATEEERWRLARELRDLGYNPQRHLHDGHCDGLLEQKRAWIARQPVGRAEYRQRFQELRRLNEELRPYVEEQVATVRAKLAEEDRQLRVNAVLRRRDYAFCLYPENELRAFCTQFLGE